MATQAFLQKNQMDSTCRYLPRRELFGTGTLSTWRHVQGDPTARLLFHPAASVVVRDKKGPDKGRMLAEGCQQAGLRRSLRKEN